MSPGTFVGHARWRARTACADYAHVDQAPARLAQESSALRRAGRRAEPLRRSTGPLAVPQLHRRAAVPDRTGGKMANFVAETVN